MELWMGFAEGGIRGWLPSLLNIVLLVIGSVSDPARPDSEGQGRRPGRSVRRLRRLQRLRLARRRHLTRITIYVAAVWILLIMILIRSSNPLGRAGARAKYSPSFRRHPPDQGDERID